MPYADTDFFMAIANEADRLHYPAMTVYQRYKGSIYTSLAVIIELALVSVKRGTTTKEPISSVIAVAGLIDANPDIVMKAAHLIDQENINVFDAFHAALCNNEIISSDSVYDGIVANRIPLSTI